MFAEVIPYTRSIRGVDSFDYAVPDELAADIAVGSTVWIPFRSKVIPGVVRKIKKEADYSQVKAIESLHPLQLWTGRVELIEWFAVHYYVSLATAFKAMQFPLLKKPRSVKIDTVAGPTQTPTKLEPLPEGEILLHYYKRTDCLNAYTNIFHSSAGNVLVVAAEYNHVEEIIASVPLSKKYVCIPESASPSFMMQLTTVLATEKDIVVIGTKKTVFLPFNLFSLVVIDQEEAIAHKQFDSNPRYHVRPCAHQASVITSTPVLYSSCAPSITLMHAANHGAVERIDHVAKTPSQLTVVNMEDEYQSQNYSWFSEKLVDNIRVSRRALLLLNRAGTYQLAQCRDCEELQPPDTTTCSQCKSTNLKRMRKGTEQLEHELRTLFEGKSVVRIDRTNTDISQEEVNSADIVIGTEKALREVAIDDFDIVGILSVDHLLIYPHFRSHERVYQLVQYIRSFNTPVLLQTHAPEHIVLRYMQQNDYAGFAQQELGLRKMLQLPPFKERVRVRINQESNWKLLQSPKKLDNLPQTAQVDREE